MEDSKRNTGRSGEMDGQEEEDELFEGSGRRAPTPQPHTPLQPSQQPPPPANVSFNSVEAQSLFPDHRHQRDILPKVQATPKSTEAGGVSRHVSHISPGSSGISVQGSCDNLQRFRQSVKEERVISPETDSGFVGSEYGRIPGRTSSLAESLRLTARSSSSHPSLPEECESDAPTGTPAPGQPVRQRAVRSDAGHGEALASHAPRAARRPGASSSRWSASTTSAWDLRGCQGGERLDDLEREVNCSLDGFPCRPLKRAELGGLDGDHVKRHTAWSRPADGLQGEDGDSPARPWDGAHGEDLTAEEGSACQRVGEEVAEAREPGVAPRAKGVPSVEGAYPDLSHLSLAPKRRSKNAARSGMERIPRSEPWAPRLQSSGANPSDLQHRDHEEAGAPTVPPPWSTSTPRAATRGQHSRDRRLTSPRHSGANYKNFPPGRPSGKSGERDLPCSGCSAKARVSERQWDSGTNVVPCPVCNGSGVCNESRSSHHEDDLLLEDLRDETVRLPQSSEKQRSKTLHGLHATPYVCPPLYGLPSALYVSPYDSRFYLPETPPRSEVGPRRVRLGRAHNEDIGMKWERELCMSLDRAIRTAEGMRRTSQRMVEFLSRDIAHVHTTHQFLFR